MNFDQLVDLCRKTHEQLLLAANRSIRHPDLRGKRMT